MALSDIYRIVNTTSYDQPLVFRRWMEPDEWETLSGFSAMVCFFDRRDGELFFNVRYSSRVRQFEFLSLAPGCEFPLLDDELLVISRAVHVRPCGRAVRMMFDFLRAPELLGPALASLRPVT